MDDDDDQFRLIPNRRREQNKNNKKKKVKKGINQEMKGMISGSRCTIRRREVGRGKRIKRRM